MFFEALNPHQHWYQRGWKRDTHQHLRRTWRKVFQLPGFDATLA
jgi:hypothetical protein